MITKNTLINDILEKSPFVAFVLKKYGMECAGCSMRYEEDIETAGMSHGVDVDMLLNEINTLLEKRKTL